MDVSGLDLILDDAGPAAPANDGPLLPGIFQPTNMGSGDTFPSPAPTPSGNTAFSNFQRSGPQWHLESLRERRPRSQCWRDHRQLDTATHSGPAKEKARTTHKRLTSCRATVKSPREVWPSSTARRRRGRNPQGFQLGMMHWVSFSENKLAEPAAGQLHFSSFCLTSPPAHV